MRSVRRISTSANRRESSLWGAFNVLHIKNMWQDLVVALEVVIISIVNYGMLSYMYKDYEHRRKNNGVPLPLLYLSE